MTFDNFLAREMAMINATFRADLIPINSFSDRNTEILHRLPANILTVQQQIAVKAYQQAIALDPNNADFQYALGYSLANSGDNASANAIARPRP